MARSRLYSRSRDASTLNSKLPMTPRWEDQSDARKRVRGSFRAIDPIAFTRARSEGIELPDAPDDAEFYFTDDGRVVALPARKLVPRVYKYVLKGLAVVGFVVAAAACGLALA